MRTRISLRVFSGKNQVCRIFVFPLCSVFAYYCNFSYYCKFTISFFFFFFCPFITIFEKAVVFIALFLGNLSMFFSVQDVKVF